MRMTLWMSFALAVGATGCFTGPSVGEEGIVELTYDEGIFGCLLGCDASEPMATDSNTFIIVVNAEEDVVPEFGAFTVDSSDASVLEFFQDEPGDASVRVASHESGSADMIFVGEDGDEFDRFEIQVEEIVRIELASPEIQSRLLIMDGGAVSLYLDLFDDRDRDLKGFGGVDYALTGGLSESAVTLTSALAEAIARAFAGSTSESATIEANALGEGSITVTAMRGDASLTIPVEVVDASAVTRVEVADVTVEPGGSASLYARAFDASGEEIHDPACEWTVSGTGVTEQFASRGSVTVTATTETTGEATCTIGSASGSGTVTFMMAQPEM